MSTPQVEIVRKLYDAYFNRDLETVYAGLSPEVTWRVIGRRSDHPAFGDWQGLAGARAFNATVAETLTFEAFELDGLYGDKDKVFATGRYAMLHRATEKRTASEFVHIFTLAGGLVVEFAEFLDTAQVAEACRG